MAPITVTLDRQPPAVGIVSLLGENDAYVAGRLETELKLLIDSGFHVVVDLSEATFVDSQVVSVLLGALYDAKAEHRGYALVLPDSKYTQVHRLLDMTGLRSLFAVYAGAGEALTSIRTGSAGDQNKGIRAA